MIDEIQTDEQTCDATGLNANRCAKKKGHRGRHDCHWGPGCCWPRKAGRGPVDEGEGER